jgi:phenylalanyl-tRNA synthetase beta chain
MKFSYEWLKRLLPGLNVPSGEIGKVVTDLGFPLDGMETVGGDVIFDFDVTGNRPDALNHLGLARELSARYGLELKAPERSFTAPRNLSVTVEAPELCPRYSARLLTGVKNGPAPASIRSTLEKLGQRSINGVVDVTNYVLLEMGHPLHAFDYSHLQGRRIVVRRATEGEKLVTLDGQERRLKPSMLVIADMVAPVALAGVMGGLHSEVGTSSSEVFLESAWFEPRNIRRTGKDLDLKTEASLRFEHGADESATMWALDRACELILDNFGGTVSGEADERTPRTPREVPFRYQKFLSFMGTMPGMEPAWAQQLLERLGFEISSRSQDTWTLRAPAFRVDVDGEQDIYEELARHYGYDRVEAELPSQVQPSEGLSARSTRTRALRRMMAARGFQETVTYSMVNAEREKRWLPMREKGICVENPLSEDMAVLRSGLLHGLVDVLNHNLRRSAQNPRFFEIGKTFHFLGSESGTVEIQNIAVVAYGARRSFEVDAMPAPPLTYYDMRGLAEDIGLLYNVHRMEFLPLTPGRDFSPYHPYRSAEIRLGDAVIGACGEIHPVLLEEYGIFPPVVFLQVSLDALQGGALLNVPFQTVPALAPVRRDLSFLVDENMPYGRVAALLMSRPWPLVAGIRLMDVYRGENIPRGKKSFAFEVEFQPVEENLREENMSAVIKDMVRLLQEKLGLELRGQV